jgi:enterochelin esterase-like enzyme
MFIPSISIPQCDHINNSMNLPRRPALLVGFCLVFACSQPAGAKVFDKDTTIAGMTVHYKVVLPTGYDPAKAYPAILAFPPGAQTMDMVMSTLVRNWAPEAQRRGYIVVIPAAPTQHLFSGDAASVFPEFLNQLLADYKIRDGKFHIAGMSNGGISAFYIASLYPRYFLSVTGFPGYLRDAAPERLDALAGLCINMHAGEFDPDWVEPMQEQAAAFRAKGFTVKMTVEKGQYHVISTLTGDGAVRLFKEIEAASKGCPGKRD